MIVPMKKVTLLCLASDKLNTLEQLRALGMMHVTPVSKQLASDTTELSLLRAECEKAYLLLQTHATDGVPAEHLTGKEVFNRIQHLQDTEAAAKKEWDSLQRDMAKLEPWGDFSQDSLTSLRKQGLFVALCSSTKEEMARIPDSATVQIIRSDKTSVWYVVFATEPIDVSLLHTVNLPDMPLHKIKEQILFREEELRAVSKGLDLLSLHLTQLKEYYDQISVDYEFARNRDGMASLGELEYLCGYVPATKITELKEAALKNGWGLVSEDPTMDDMDVPTLIQKPKWLNILDPLFDFIGVTPGYRENDVNLFFIVFFPVFFALIIGDAGYAVLFIAAALIVKFTVCRGKEAARLPLNLFLLLSCYTLVWGWLNGCWFGIPRAYLPVWMSGLDFLVDPKSSPLALSMADHLHVTDIGMMKDKIIQLLCFLLAALHLSAARIVKFLVDLPQTWRSWGNLGWALMIWANFFLATELVIFPGSFPKVLGISFYAVGILLILVTISGQAILNLPFSLIGSFVDVLSYIRLFAVGLSSAYIAENFNKMGGMAMDAMPQSLYILGLLVLVAVALFGHTLNIGLGFLGVLVHAIRLNTLEFSNHFELQWLGIKYEPFANKKSETK